ncbi:MAG: hypothetical protein GF365_01850 [Candidatus Buchananbacteria bacterium]|nr:hypothetical protein [Candidatus Buchananbacteria bacterium]
MECQNPKNLEFCNCNYPCDKKGFCCECLAYHRAKNEVPACYFTAEQEKTYDRSIEYFFKKNKKK